MNTNNATYYTNEKKKIMRFIRYFLIFFLFSTFSFGAGWFFAIDEQKTPVSIEYDFSVLPERMRGESENFTKEIPTEVGVVVGSLNGNVYHLPWCPGAQQMNEENKRWFESVKKAEDAGYIPAKNCKGL